jgi:hypothetical protein
MNDIELLSALSIVGMMGLILHYFASVGAI